MAATVRPPLVSPMHYDPAFKVDIHLHAPLLSRGATPADLRLEMMSLCFQLEMLCKKELAEQSSIQNGHVSNSFIDRATVVCDRIQHLMMKVSPELQDYQRYIQVNGLDQLFPRAVAYLSNPKGFSMTLEKTGLDGYFTSLSNLSQLSTLARQIHSDAASSSSHKYVAHQLAVLYQVISSVKATTFAHHRKSIEDMFKPIKATLASCPDNQPRCLTTEQQEWLLNITSNILNVIGTFPQELTQEMKAPATILQSCR